MPLSHMFAKANLKRAVKQTEEARQAEGEDADKLFDTAFRGYASVVQNDPIVEDALYHWGLALYYQAQTKTGEAAQSLYQSACDKFAACLAINPGLTSAAIDWGVALMEKARAGGAPPDHPLYEEARAKFLMAIELLRGSAAYNLACLHSLRGEYEECRKFLEAAHAHGSLPDEEQIHRDKDLANARSQAWFQAFLASLASDERETKKPDNTHRPENSEKARDLDPD